MANYRIGVIGHTGRGNYGHGIDTVWARVPNCEVVAVSDPNEAGRAGDEYSSSMTCCLLGTFSAFWSKSFEKLIIKSPRIQKHVIFENG